MGNLVDREAWATIDLETTRGHVFVQQDWHYDWRVWPGQKPWTYPEKHAFHTRVDREIWGSWSNKLLINVTGTAPFSARQLPVTFDVRWWLGATWNYRVEAWKVPPGSSPTSPIWSQVVFDDYIRLSTADIRPRPAGNNAGQSNPGFVTPPHEFGHTIYNPQTENPDEYTPPNASPPNPWLGDTGSIMNIGRQVRGRHLTLICETLHKMVPTAGFSA